MTVGELWLTTVAEAGAVLKEIGAFVGSPEIKVHRQFQQPQQYPPLVDPRQWLTICKIINHLSTVIKNSYFELWRTLGRARGDHAAPKNS